MTKTTKIQLISKNDDVLEYKEVNKLLWELQRETRTAANRCIQLCWEYSGFESDWKKKHGEYPTREENKEILGKSLSTVIYNRIKEDAPSMNTGNLSMLSQGVCGRFNAIKGDILRGNVSIPSYKSNIPIELHKNSAVRLARILLRKMPRSPPHSGKIGGAGARAIPCLSEESRKPRRKNRRFVRICQERHFCTAFGQA